MLHYLTLNTKYTPSTNISQLVLSLQRICHEFVVIITVLLSLQGSIILQGNHLYGVAEQFATHLGQVLHDIMLVHHFSA